MDSDWLAKHNQEMLEELNNPLNPPISDRFVGTGDEVFSTPNPLEADEMSKIFVSRVGEGGEPHDFQPSRFPSQTTGQVRCLICGENGIIEEDDEGIGYMRCRGFWHARKANKGETKMPYIKPTESTRGHPLVRDLCRRMPDVLELRAAASVPPGRIYLSESLAGGWTMRVHRDIGKGGASVLWSKGPQPDLVWYPEVAHLRRTLSDRPALIEYVQFMADPEMRIRAGAPPHFRKARVNYVMARSDDLERHLRALVSSA